MLWLFAPLTFAGPDPAIQDHLFEVVDTLRVETPASLTDHARARRLALLDLLENYARAGEFPDNQPEREPAVRAVLPPRGFEGSDAGRAPVFVDDRDVHCAVGYLMAADSPELVAHIVETANDGYLLEMDLGGVAEWAAHAGFTLDELAWIQPEYPTRVGTCPDPESVADAIWGRRDTETEACGPVDVTVWHSDDCQLCGEAFHIVANVTSLSEEDVSVDLVLRAADGREVGRREGLEVQSQRTMKASVTTLDWADVVNVGATLSVEVAENCQDAEGTTVELWMMSEDGTLDPPRCCGGGCATSPASSNLTLMLLGLVALFRRRR